MITTPGTDTPGIYESDVRVLAWAALFADSNGGNKNRAELLAGAEFADTHPYPVLVGRASSNTAGLLHIINTLAARLRNAEQRAERLQEDLDRAEDQAETWRELVDLGDARALRLQDKLAAQ